MLHRRIQSSPDAHYGVNVNADRTLILVQLGDADGDQSRVSLTVEEVDDMIALLQQAKAKLLEKT